jgi:hypothetical protein
MVTSETLATMGKFASIVNIKGVIPTESTKEETLKALSPLTVFLNGASYTTLTVSLAATVVLSAVVCSGVRYPASGATGSIGSGGFWRTGLRGERPPGWSWGFRPELAEEVGVGLGGGTGGEGEVDLCRVRRMRTGRCCIGRIKMRREMGEAEADAGRSE